MSFDHYIFTNFSNLVCRALNTKYFMVGFFKEANKEVLANFDILFCGNIDKTYRYCDMRTKEDMARFIGTELLVDIFK
jgi:lipopolysaccharide biosynthesis glycosyltransferase